MANFIYLSALMKAHEEGKRVNYMDASYMGHVARIETSENNIVIHVAPEMPWRQKEMTFSFFDTNPEFAKHKAMNGFSIEEKVTLPGRDC